MAFKYKLQQNVRILPSSECGKIVGRAEYTDGKPNYLVRYMAADWRAVEAWWAQSALETLDPSTSEAGCNNPFEGGFEMSAAPRNQIMKHFAYQHLPARLQAVSKPIGDLARLLDEDLPDCAEKSAGLRKLLEAKDCFVRAKLEDTAD